MVDSTPEGSSTDRLSPVIRGGVIRLCRDLLRRDPLRRDPLRRV
jgi:hypothetical protein